MDDVSSFRWAILGTGVVSRKFVLGLRSVPGHAAVVCASRSPDNAARFAQDFGLTPADYATAAAHSEADAVYVATPPSEHEAHALMAIAAGKPVLVEKPFALDARAADRIRAAAQAAGTFAMEAMWTRFLPLIVALKTKVDAGDLGDLRAFEARFYGSDLPDPMSSLFDPDRGGGALMHRGVYGLSLARRLLGPVTEVQAMAQIGETGVDEDCAVTLRHDNGAISTIRASLRATGSNAAELYGTKTTYRIAAPIYRPFAARRITATPRAHQAGGQARAGRLEQLKEGGTAQRLNQRLNGLRAFISPPGQSLSAPFAGNGYGHEAEAVATAVRAGQSEHAIMPLGESVEIMELIDAARASFKTPTGL